MPPPTLIVLSGVDGAGKSTQIARLADTYRELGARPLVLWSRIGYTPGMEFIKRSLRRGLRGGIMPPTGDRAGRAEAFRRPWVRWWWLRLALCDLFWRLAIVTRWYRLRGHTVICDRGWADSRMDVALHFPGERLAEGWLWQWMEWLSPKPRAAFLLLIPPEHHAARTEAKQDPFPLSSQMFHQRWIRYVELSQRGGWHVLDGTRSIDDIAQEIAFTLELIPVPGSLVAR